MSDRYKKTMDVLSAIAKIFGLDGRAELSAILADSLGDGSPPSEIEAAWLSEAKRRLQAVRAGESAVVPSEDVERELDEIVHAAPKSG